MQDITGQGERNQQMATAVTAGAKGAIGKLNKVADAVKESIESVRRPTSKQAAKILEGAGYGKPGDGWEAHHIILFGAGYESAELARQILSDFGIGINDPDNFVWLPKNIAVKKQYGVRHLTHQNDGLHRRESMDAVLGAIEMAVDERHARATLRSIANRYRNGINLY
ncbi:AHH domain-containing protein [Pseudoalteromonas luteoviolacea]|uniref:A nuclease family of the HNH/ENDO VII superfamily with conserved AHH n=1 Tax=Pseudoalteromonas luteoviolacea DSM 6061 TaxID=1365250 RepID=A0A162AAC9_9GAMM|nr:AHH domain-containing protein [Pseudoalteromonas luteoviolacea]KZN46633.1 hypothetical protein N475_25620 [Pseudoalteromonas luteoviolacea DSM 6061]MBE0388661.1 hypothetical protein [Pseudoalteromonas luteoviolacea DSM 6061]MBE0389477.1 hypothetical protein [Pseudoalteromonas luteoviolacea DSM 6061]